MGVTHMGYLSITRIGYRRCPRRSRLMTSACGNHAYAKLRIAVLNFDEEGQTDELRQRTRCQRPCLPITDIEDQEVLERNGFWASAQDCHHRPRLDPGYAGVLHSNREPIAVIESSGQGIRFLYEKEIGCRPSSDLSAPLRPVDLRSPYTPSAGQLPHPTVRRTWSKVHSSRIRHRLTKRY